MDASHEGGEECGDLLALAGNTPTFRKHFSRAVSANRAALKLSTRAETVCDEP